MTNDGKNRGDGPRRRPGGAPRGSAGANKSPAPRAFGGKPRPTKSFSDKPFAGRPNRGEAGTERVRDGSSRPDKRREGNSHPGSDPTKSFRPKSFSAKSFTDKPRPAKSFSDRPYAGRPNRGEPGTERVRDGSSRPDRQREGKSHPGSGSTKSFRPKSFSDKSFTDKPRQNRPRAPAVETIPDAADDNDERIAKVIARAGLCSRRDAEAWIAAGRVEVNGVRLRSPALNVRPSDAILVDGRPLAQRERTRLFLFHKPRGFVTTDRDPQDRPTVFSILPPDLPRVVTIGRLDINTEGLLLLTNDGGLARVLELPATGWVRRYRVRAKGTPDLPALEALSEGITIDGIRYAGIVATLDRVQGANVWLTMALREGKNREIKRVLEHLGLTVNRLIRISFGPFQLGELDERAVEEVKTRVIQDQLGMTLAKEASVDFTGPVVAPIVTIEENERRRQARFEERSFGEKRDAPSRHRSFRDDRSSVPQRHDRDRSGRGHAEVEQPPRRDRPQPSPRKHVSTLRREKMETGAEKRVPRRRVERAETADRKGRTVAVERIAAPSDAGERSSRNGRRFAEQKDRTRERRSDDRGPPRSRPSTDKRSKPPGRHDTQGGPRPPRGRPRGKS